MNKKRPFLLKPLPGESLEDFKLRVKQLVIKQEPVQRKRISEGYTVAYLATHPQTKKILLKYLLPIMKDPKPLEFIDCSLEDLHRDNMGGGIPYDVMMKLKEELNSLGELKDSTSH